MDEHFMVDGFAVGQIIAQAADTDLDVAAIFVHRVGQGIERAGYHAAGGVMGQ